MGFMVTHSVICLLTYCQAFFLVVTYKSLALYFAWLIYNGSIVISISILCCGNFKLIKLAFCFGLLNQIIELKIISKKYKATKFQPFSLYPGFHHLIKLHAEGVPQSPSKEAAIPLDLKLYFVSPMVQWEKCQAPRDGGWPQGLCCLHAVFKATVQTGLGNGGFPPETLPHPFSTFEPH